MGAVNTTYTFTATDTITSTKMNNIIDETVITSDAVLGGSGGSGGLDIASGKLSISANAINSSRLASNSVTTNAITDGNVTPSKLSTGRPSWTPTLTGGVFGVQQSGIELGTGTASDFGCFVDFHSAATPTDFECRLVRDGGANGNFNVINTGAGAISISNTGAGAVTFSTSNLERMRITASGNVGVNTVTPISKLGITASTSNISPESSAHGLSIYAGDNGKEMCFGYDSSVDIGYINASKSGSLRPIVLQSRGGTVGIGKTNPSTTLDVNGIVTATSFSGPLTGNVTGNVTGSASTVNNSSITAAKLDGNQSGSAPIYGCRAWVSFVGRSTNGDCTIRSAGNVYRVARTAEGRYTVYFTTAMQDAEYATIAGSDANSAHKIAGVISQAAGEVNIAYSQIQTSTARIDPTWGQVSIFR